MQLLHKIFHKPRPTLGKNRKKIGRFGNTHFRHKIIQYASKVREPSLIHLNAPIRTTIAHDAPAQSGDTPDIKGHLNSLQKESATCLFPHRSSLNC